MQAANQSRGHFRVAVISLRWRKKYCFDSFLASFFSFYFLNALQSDNDSKTVYVLGHKYILGASQSSFEHLLHCSR